VTLPTFAAERRAAAPLLLSTGACYRSTSPHCGRWELSSKPIARRCCVRSIDGTDRRMDGRTPDRFIDPAPHTMRAVKKGKGSPYSVTERRVPELIPVLGSQPAGDVTGGRLPLLSARPAVPPATLKRAATNFAAW